MPAPTPLTRDELAGVIESAPFPTAILAADGRFLAVNRAFDAMLGYPRAQLMRKSIEAIIHPDEFLRNPFGSGDAWELRLLHRDGRDVRVLASQSLHDGAGRPLRILQAQPLGTQSASGVLLGAPRALALQLGSQAQWLDQSGDALVVHDLAGTIRFWNRGAQRMFGFTRDQAEGRELGALMGSRAALPPVAMDELLAHGNWAGESECRDALGVMHVTERRCTLLRVADGTPDAVASFHTDITERRRAETEIVLLNNMLEQRIRKRTAELEESNDDLRDFAYSLAHDLRAPLSSIDGYSAQLEMRLGEELDEKGRHYLRRVRAGVALMSDLTDALLALADLSNTQLLHRSVDLSSLAHSVIERLREQHPGRCVEVTVEDTPRAQGDVRLLSAVMENLLGNAWKFTSRTNTAHIAFGSQRLPGGEVVYHVRDNGAGFDPAYAYKMFSPFQRLHRANEFEGTGIGLAMVRKILSRHAGRIWAESSPGEGASFYFTLNEAASARSVRAQDEAQAGD